MEGSGGEVVGWGGTRGECEKRKREKKKKKIGKKCDP